MKHINGGPVPDLMRGVALPAWLLCLTLLSGCIADDTPVDPAVDDASVTELVAEPQIIEWDGYTTHAVFDPLAHMKDPETVLWPIQQAGFLVEIADVPEAIEVMVSWEGDAGYMLHPHYTAENDEALGGDTLYYGYPSEMFTTSPGCIRLPAEDMAAGMWPMMVHPQSGTMNHAFTITVGILGAEGVVLDDMHGHRSDGASPVDNREVDPCAFLVEPEASEAEA